MSRPLVTPGRPVTSRIRSKRFLAAGLAVAIAIGGAAIAYSGADPGAPSKPDAAQAAPIPFGDPPVVKGARGGKTDAVTLRVFGDPTVHKGAGGR
jgi:hypothetical protein